MGAASIRASSDWSHPPPPLPRCLLLTSLLILPGFCRRSSFLGASRARSSRRASRRPLPQGLLRSQIAPRFHAS
eukprot:3820644-Rhodomonas_salina.1